MRVAQAARRVLVVDDHRVLADLIAQAVDASDDAECVGVAGDVDDALAQAKDTRPDTIVMDAQLPSGDGVELLPRLRKALPDVRVIVLTARPRPDRERVAFQAGAVGYLGKDAPLATLLTAIRDASPETPARDPQMQDQAAAAQPLALSPREREVLALLAEGRYVQQIAAELGLSAYTTRDHVKAILAKLGASSQLEAVAIAAREGLVRVG
ncbi:response regulator [Tessaracoccus caeni]|uniref:response regulator n=1 Tax=Tessaracoccus caeni TaxID=3031239 RepID=UPI0023DCEA10|nr:response regulator transcription factor [Tessaracoccus caeni]MDF1489787.1 response regulator transcription factor [Tessaracoccus caeni]